MPTLGIKSKDIVKKYILEIYDIAHRIAPINDFGTDSTNPHWKDIYRIANLSNAITRDFNHACFEAQQLQLRLCNVEADFAKLKKELECLKSPPKM